MNSIKIHPGVRRLLSSYIFAFAILIIFNVTGYAMKARLEGMSVSEALGFGLHSSLLSGSLIGIHIAYLGMSLALIFSLKKEVKDPKTPAEAGREQWQRFHKAQITTFAMISLIMAGIALYIYVTGQWTNRYFVFLGLSIISGLGSVAILQCKPPSSYGLHILETGKMSRLDDERMQNINEKSAYTTIKIFFFILLLGVLPYQSIVEGHWALDVIVVIGIFFIIHATTFKYWMRKL